MNRDNLILCDVECYQNYFLVMFKKITTGQVVYFEKHNDGKFDIQRMLSILKKRTLVTFNGLKYDAAIIEAAASNMTNGSLYKISNMIIEDQKPAWKVRNEVGFKELDLDQIDLIEVAPLIATLKIYGGRLHCPTMKDLPILPDRKISAGDLPELRQYCENDLDVTGLLFEKMESELDLRVTMGEQYGVDVRSKSDAQIAEAVIKEEIDRKYGYTPTRPNVDPGTQYRYRPPENLVFDTEILKSVMAQYCTRPFTVAYSGHIEFGFKLTEADRSKKGVMPTIKKKLQFKLGGTEYTVGTGGLHSREKSIRHSIDDHGGCILREYDVTSYYPRIILNNELAPKHIGKPFLEVYKSIVDRRLEAKKNKESVISESLKITINGSFGKLGSKWSCLYSPDLMIQVTITGQLTLLMLIERLELAGVSVVSANTDGIVVKLRKDKNQSKIADDIVMDWEFDTGYDMESSEIVSLNCRDVNNYITIKEDGVKGKGAYSDQSAHFYALRSNPVNTICVKAVKNFLNDGTPVEDTILSCRDITEFLTLRKVNGGAVKEGVKLGRAIRWYYGKYELDAIHYLTGGNKVPKSDGGVPLMELPEEFPTDVDFDRYIQESETILEDIGYFNNE